MGEMSNVCSFTFAYSEFDVKAIYCTRFLDLLSGQWLCDAFLRKQSPEIPAFLIEKIHYNF